MEGAGANARIAGAAAFASMEGTGIVARIAGAAAFASMEGQGTIARIVGAAAFASMEGRGANARIARAVDLPLRWDSQHKRVACSEVRKAFSKVVVAAATA